MFCSATRHDLQAAVFCVVLCSTRHCVVQVIQDLVEDGIMVTKFDDKGQPERDARGQVVEVKQAGHFVLDVKQRQAALTEEGLSTVFLTLRKLPSLSHCFCCCCYDKTPL